MLSCINPFIATSLFPVPPENRKPVASLYFAGRLEIDPWHELG